MATRLKDEDTNMEIYRAFMALVSAQNTWKNCLNEEQSEIRARFAFDQLIKPYSQALCRDFAKTLLSALIPDVLDVVYNWIITDTLTPEPGKQNKIHFTRPSRNILLSYCSYKNTPLSSRWLPGGVIRPAWANQPQSSIYFDKSFMGPVFAAEITHAFCRRFRFDLKDVTHVPKVLRLKLFQNDVRLVNALRRVSFRLRERGNYFQRRGNDCQRRATRFLWDLEFCTALARVDVTVDVLDNWKEELEPLARRIRGMGVEFNVEEE